MFDQKNTRHSKQGFKCVCDETMLMIAGVQMCVACGRRYLIERVYTIEIDENSDTKIFKNGQVKES